MKITRFEVIPLKQRGLLLKVHTDSELVGYGSPMNYEHGRTVARAIHDMADYLVGRDPRQIEDHWQTLFRSSYSRQMPIMLSALSGIEHACLDILGKSLDEPVWRLLGSSCRERVRVYASVGGHGADRRPRCRDPRSRGTGDRYRRGLPPGRQSGHGETPPEGT